LRSGTSTLPTCPTIWCQRTPRLTRALDFRLFPPWTPARTRSLVSPSIGHGSVSPPDVTRARLSAATVVFSRYHQYNVAGLHDPSVPHRRGWHPPYTAHERPVTSGGAARCRWAPSPAHCPDPVGRRRRDQRDRPGFARSGLDLHAHLAASTAGTTASFPRRDIVHWGDGTSDTYSTQQSTARDARIPLDGKCPHLLPNGGTARPWTFVTTTPAPSKTWATH